MAGDGERLSFKPDIRYFRDRIISAPEGKEAAEKAVLEVVPSMVGELQRRIDGVLGKLDTLMEQVRKTARDSLPVHEQAYEVRKALRELYPGRPEDRIYIDEYINSLHYQFSRVSVDPISLISQLTGNAEVDSRLVSQEQWKSSDGISPKELAIFTGQYMLCLVANKIMQPYAAPDVQKQTAPKLYPSTEIPGMTMQVLIGLAALILQIVENIDSVKGLLQDTMKDIPGLQNVDVDELIARAKGQGRDPQIDRYMTQNRPYYHNAIIRFADDYMGNTVEPGYEHWVSYTQMLDQKDQLQQDAAEIKRYEGSTGVAPSNQPKRPMGRDLYQVTASYLDTINGIVDRIATVLGKDWTSDLLCCFVLFIGAIPTDKLKGLRFALSIAANGINVDLSAQVASLSTRSNQFLYERLLTPIMHAVDESWDRMVKEILDVIDVTKWSKWPEWQDGKAKMYADIIAQCPLVDHVLEFGLYSLEFLKSKIKEMLRRAWRRAEVQAIRGNYSWKLMADSKKAKFLLRILDSVIQAIERGNLCAREGGRGPSASELQDFVDQVAADLPGAVMVPTGGDPYTTFTLAPFRSAHGLDVPISSTTPEERAAGTKPFAVGDCMREHADLQSIALNLGASEKDMRVLREAGGTDEARNSP